MSTKPFRHVLKKHHVPAMKTAVLGIALAVLIILAASSCPEKGACGSSFIFLVVLFLVLIPLQTRHKWHLMGHGYILYHVLALTVALAILVFAPGSALARTASAIIVFIALVLAKKMLRKI